MVSRKLLQPFWPAFCTSKVQLPFAIPDGVHDQLPALSTLTVVEA